MNSNALDVILMSILDMIGIETQETKDVKSGKKAIEDTKANRLSPKDQKFKTGGQTEMFNNRGKLRDFRSPAQSATRQPTTSPVPRTNRTQLNPGPVRPPAPGQGTLGGEVPRNMRLRAPAVPPRMGTPTAAGPQTKPPIRGESYKDLKAKPNPKSPGVKGPAPSGPSTPLSKAPGKLTRFIGKAPVKSELGAMAIMTALNQLISRFPGQDPEISRKLNQALVSYWTGNVDEEGRVLDIDGLPIEAERTPEVAPETPELPESEDGSITMPEITPQPMNLSEEARQSYWDQAPLTPVVPPRNPSQAPVRATRDQLRPAQVDQTMPNMGYETVSPNRGQLAPNPFRR